MPQLIQMRQRMRAIETIKKITHAMQLVAISTLLRLRNQKDALHTYKTTIADLFSHAYASVPSWQHPCLTPNRETGPSLIIVIGSQKGLCGNFNTLLNAFFERDTIQKNKTNIRIITIGKKTTEYIRQRGAFSLIKHFDDFHINNIQQITAHLMYLICTGPEVYSTVSVYSNIPKTFFLQKPHCTDIVPLMPPSTQEGDAAIRPEYIWEQSASDIVDELAQQVVYTTLYELLFQSLLSEQAARFIAMDQATKNAGSLLDTMKLNYNKLRQSKITRELTDLIGGFF